MTNIKSAFGDFLARHLEKHYSHKAAAHEAKKVKYLKKQKSPNMQITKIHFQAFTSARFLTIALCLTILVPSLITIVHAETEADSDAADLSSLAAPDPEPEEEDDLEIVPATSSELDTATPEADATEADPEVAVNTVSEDSPQTFGAEPPLEVWGIVFESPFSEDTGYFLVPKNGKIGDAISPSVTLIIDRMFTYHNIQTRFKNFTVDDQTFTSPNDLLNYTLKKDSTHIKANYEVDITVEGVEGKVTVPYGSKVTPEIQGLFQKQALAQNKYNSYWYITPDKSNKVDMNNTTFTKHSVLNRGYYVLVKFNNLPSDETNKFGAIIDEGAQLSEAIKQFSSLSRSKEKTFTGQFADRGITPQANITENKTYTPLFNIDVTINGRKATLAEGKKLKDHPYYNSYKNRSGFKEFRSADGSKVDDDTELHKHTTVTAIYTIKVTVPSAFGQGGKTVFEMESGDNMNTKVPSEVLSKLKAADSRGRTFSRLVDSRGNTVNTNEALYDDTTVTPKYNNAITVARRGDNGQPIDAGKLSLQVEEGTTLNSSNSSNINSWVNQQIQTLKSEGKTNPKLSYYTVNGRRIDPASYTSLNHNDQVVAVFTSEQQPVVDPGPPSTPNPTPTEPETTPNPESDSGPASSTTPPSAGTVLKAPNTAGAPADFDFALILLISLSVAGFLGVRIYRRRKHSLSSKI